MVGPRAADDRATVPASTTLTVPVERGVLANDSGTGLTAELDEPPLHGTVDLAADGSYSYTPTADWSGSDRFTYTATDASGARDHRPCDHHGHAPHGGRPDPHRGRPVRHRHLGRPHRQRPRHRSHRHRGREPERRHRRPERRRHRDVHPAPGTSGRATFDYQVTGANGNTATGTVTVTITPVVAASDADATADGTLVVPADRGPLAGATGTDLSVTDNTQPQHGTVEVGKDGSYTYTPAPDFSGKDGFEVTITDGSGTTTTGTVTITVAPKAVDDAVTTTTDTPVDVPVLANDKGTALRVTGVGAAANGSVRVTDAGVTYTPAAGCPARTRSPTR